MVQALRKFLPFLDSEVQSWSLEARLLHWLTFLWLSIGLVVLFSASYPIADVEYSDGLYYLKRQLLWVVLGIFTFKILVQVPIRKLLRIAKWLLLFFMGSILITLVPGLGTTVNGATRWIAVGPLSFQPSELIKPVLVLQSAQLFGQWQKFNWRIQLGWISVFAIILSGILLQPNLSTTALCAITLWLMALAASLPWIYLAGTAIGGGLFASISIYFQDYQRRRIISFLNPWADPTGDGYQLVQSLLAVGSGGTWGSTFGLSQQKLFYLPIQHTDFIFAVFAEEFGFVGSILLILLLMTYATLCLIVVSQSQNPVHRLVIMGTMILLVGQALIHIGVTTGVLPTTGLPFPFFSYGGSSIISSLISAGLLIRVARESYEADIVSLPKRLGTDRRPRSSLRKS